MLVPHGLLSLLILFKWEGGTTETTQKSKLNFPELEKRHSAFTDVDWNKRISIPDLNDLFIHQTQALNVKTVKVKLIGQSTMKKNIYALEIIQSLYYGGTVFIHGGINGNEWKSVSFAMYIVDQLLSEYTGLLMWLRFVIVPLVNPDGYEKAEHDENYIHNVNPNAECPGVDLAINFDIGTTAGSRDCHTYQGPHFFSEVESINIKRYFEELRDVKLYIDLHEWQSRDPFLGFPFAYKAVSHNSSIMAQNMQKAAKGRNLIIGSLFELNSKKLYPGSSVDWAAEKMKVKNCFYFNLGKFPNAWVAFPAFFEAIRYAIIQVQVTDPDVGLAFAKECMIPNDFTLGDVTVTEISKVSAAMVLNFKVVHCLYAYFLAEVFRLNILFF